MKNTDTPEKILDAAEELFAEDGFSSVSVRSIVNLAGVNLALVNYHFGSRDELVCAVIKRRLSQINKKRLALFKEYKSEVGENPIPLKKLLHAFLSPCVELVHDKASGGQNFLRVIARAHAETAAHIQKALSEELTEVIKLFLTEINKTLPNISRAECGMRLTFTVGAMFQMMILPLKAELVNKFIDTKYSNQAMLELLINYCESGFRGESNA